MGDLFGGPSLTGVARRKIGMLNKTKVMEVVAVLVSLLWVYMLLYVSTYLYLLTTTVFKRVI